MSIDPNLVHTYSVNGDQINSFRDQLSAQGISVARNANSGTIEAHGVTIYFSYDGTLNLTLTIVSKPFYIPTSVIWSGLEKYLAMSP